MSECVIEGCTRHVLNHLTDICYYHLMFSEEE